MSSNIFQYRPGKYAAEINLSLDSLREKRIVSRIWDHDHTVWKDIPDEITNRLGWLNSPEDMREAVPRIEDLVRDVLNDGFTDALLLGMGGSSLAPDLFAKVFGARPGYLDLKVLDSTDPAAVRAHAEKLDPAKTLFIISTKSGTTTETLSFFKYFYNLTVKTVGEQKASAHFIAITDPGSPLESLAMDIGFRDAFLNNPDIGGRYSALSFFGLVPAALLGIDIRLLLDGAAGMAEECGLFSASDFEGNTGAVLGTVIGTLHNLGVNKLTLFTSPSISALGAWLEQLIAESTGKQGRGILPVEGEKSGPPSVYESDRVFACICMSGDNTHEEDLPVLEEEGFPAVRIVLKDLYDLGGEFYRWEFAVAVAGHVMGINPFDQPDVESAKVQARSMLDRFHELGHLPSSRPAVSEEGIEVYTDFESPTPAAAMQEFLDLAIAGDYVAIQAWLDPIEEVAFALDNLRHHIRDHLQIATTVGFGPRYLHSTGQLHKGDRGTGLFIQITAADSEDLPIPDEAGKEASSITFGILKAAQAQGDLQALKKAARRVIRFHLKGDVVQGIRQMMEWVG